MPLKKNPPVHIESAAIDDSQTVDTLSKPLHVKSSDRVDIPSNFASTAGFITLIVTSLSLSFVLYFFAAPFTSGDLATASARRDEWWQIVIAVAWRGVELGFGWYGGYDTVDEGSLILLTHLPYFFLLTSFYKIRPTTASICLAIDLVSLAAPFALLRKSSKAHKLMSSKSSVNNAFLINDWFVQLLISLFATGIYAVVVFGAFHTFMPKWLVTHFDGIKDITTLYNSTFIWLCVALLPTGFAAKTFLFTPPAAAKPDAYDQKCASFNAELATLGETVEYNFLGFSKRVRVLAQRTLVLGFLAGANTWLQTYLSVEGAEGFGAAGWASIWSAAALLTGVSFGWVLNVD